MIKSNLRRTLKENNKINDRDLLLLARKFETYELPKDKKYLLNYFDNELQEAFLKYFFVFKDYDNFIDHTGIFVQKKWLDSLYKKLLSIEQAHKDAKSNFDMSGLLAIERGKFKFTRHPYK